MKNNPTEEKVRVLVVDDQQLIRDGIASLLSIQPGIEVVATACDGQQAVERALENTPDVILMDIRMPEMDGIEATSCIRRKLPNCQVLVLTTFDDDEYVVKALVAGASGYLLKDIPVVDLAQAIRLVNKGIYQLEPTIAGKLVGELTQSRPSTAGTIRPEWAESEDWKKLTEREREVLHLIAKGATNQEIAEALVISLGTVKNHVSNILACLGVRDRTQAALYAHDQGLV